MKSALNPIAVFRRRSGWEAADMGVLLWRKNWFPMVLFIGIPLAVLFCLYLFITRAEIIRQATQEWSDLRLNQIIVFFIWWIKPFLDRFCLHVVSVRFFEPEAPMRRLFKGLGRTIRTGLLGDLLWRRFSPARSARMPLLVLERLKGKNYKRRKNLLARNGLAFGLPLTVICLCMASALNGGELIFFNNIFNMINGEARNLFTFIGEESVLVFVLYFFNLFLLEMLFVSMGFSLYINSRVETEGWDIELLFKNCVEKKRKPHAAFSVPLVALFFFFAAIPAWTEDESLDPSLETKMETKTQLLSPSEISEKDAETLERILDSPDFGSAKPSRRIRFKPSKGEGQIDTPRYSSFLENISAHLLRIVLIASLLAALGIIVMYAYRHRSRFFPNLHRGKSTIKSASPDDCLPLLLEAEELHRKGRIREGWALCFRAFISVFAKLWFFPYQAEATEYDALEFVRKNASDKGLAGFEVFINRWIALAYGGREPGSGYFEEAIASCRLLLEKEEASE